ncbi:hypothetical protein DYB30_002699 [Aphanomyces astaci]|uniref:Major facilitator superfamily (MFS) profile domain-containing protein n=1 Tax=Aphanomyces astaci TaxID=112090 RepID=A0A397DEB6_APHAT|nr:hypothetical protein DYB36_000268 [Aphanomyces astaci]RHY60962.1 hypothetical protein DYB30_002699 [Aphanomyces astaci]
MTTEKQRLLALTERASYTLSDERIAKSPTALEDGALVHGGALSLLSREAMGLFSQYFAIGIVYGMIPALKYPLFNVYLSMEPYQVSSYGVMVTLGWSYKVLFGMLSDCCPIFGYRRKSWMLIGWVTTMICLTIMAFSTWGDPYCNRDTTDSCDKPLSAVNATDFAANYNPRAPDNGSAFIILSMFVSFGYVTAACAADAMVVQYAQREPLSIRGRVQTAIYTIRNIAGMLALSVTAFGLNGVQYNGSFSFSMAPNIPYAICLIPCVLAVLTTVFVVVEDKHIGISFSAWWGSFWELLQTRVMWQICAFRFINSMFFSIATTADNGMATHWAKVEPVNDSLASLIGKAIFASTLTAMGKWGLRWNWRYLIALGSVGMVVVDGIVNFVTIWDVVRNQWFYTGLALVNNVPDGIRFIVGMYCTVEVADVGTEGATYGLITTMGNLAGPFASVVYKYVNSYFLLSNDDFKKDTTAVRWDVTYVYLISFACKLFSLVFLVMLPPQKSEMQQLKRKGGKSKVAGVLLIVTFVTCLAFSMASSVMSIYPTTKCYRLAGGNGKLDLATGGCPNS